MKQVFFPVNKLTPTTTVLDVTKSYNMQEYMKPLSVVEIIPVKRQTHGSAVYVRFPDRDEIDMTSSDYLHALKDFDIVEHKEA